MDKKQLVSWVSITLREAAWAPLSIIAFYGIGLALHLYDLFPPLDLPSHLLGGVAITYFFRSAIKNSQSLVGDIPIPIQIIFAFTCTGTTIIFWEFYENLLDLFFGTHTVRGLEDTIMDMFLGLLGALVFTLLYRRR
jgi:hypothetical protein